MATPASIYRDLSDSRFLTVQALIDDVQRTHSNFDEYTQWLEKDLAHKLGEQIKELYGFEVEEDISDHLTRHWIGVCVLRPSELLTAPKSAYVAGRIQGIEDYSWMKDGTTYVGTTGKTLKQAVKEVEDSRHE